jgi:hypothetical protein
MVGREVMHAVIEIFAVSAAVASGTVMVIALWIERSWREAREVIEATEEGQ